jgi:hypothetical protein
MFDVGVYNITSLLNNKFHEEQWPWACLDITHEVFHFLHGI